MAIEWARPSNSLLQIIWILKPESETCMHLQTCQKMKWWTIWELHLIWSTTDRDSKTQELLATPAWLASWLKPPLTNRTWPWKDSRSDQLETSTKPSHHLIPDSRIHLVTKMDLDALDSWAEEPHPTNSFTQWATWITDSIPKERWWELPSMSRDINSSVWHLQVEWNKPQRTTSEPAIPAVKVKSLKLVRCKWDPSRNS